MLLRFAFSIGVAAVVLATPLWAQTSPPAEPVALAQAAPPGEPAAPAAPGDVFGEDATLTAKPMLFIKGSGKWDTAFDTISKSLKKLETYIDKEGLKADGLPMAIFTAMDDAGFDFEAAIRIAAAPKNAPRGDIALGQSPEAHAFKFAYHGSYAGLEDTYEAIYNYMDDKRLEASQVIEEYVTDPASGDANKLVINIFVIAK